MSISSIGKQATSAAETPSDSWVTVLWRLARRKMRQIAELRQMRRDAALLLSMDDRILADVGLRRCEIEYALRHGRRPADPPAADDR